MKAARNPAMVALILFALLTVALILYLASAALERRAARKSPMPWSPPGWTGPTSPPPAHE